MFLNKGLRREASWILTGQLGSAAGALISVKLLTSILGATEYGRLALALSIAGLINGIAFEPLRHTVGRYFHHFRSKNQLAFFARGIGGALLVVSFSIIFLSSTIVFGLRPLSYGSLSLPLIAVSVLIGIFRGQLTSLYDLQTQRRRRRNRALHEAGDAWLRACFIAALLSVAAPTAEIGILAYLGAIIFTALSQATILGREIQDDGNIRDWLPTLKDTWQLRRTFWNYGAPFFVISIGVMAASYGDRWILDHVATPEAVGGIVAIQQIIKVPVGLGFGLVSQLIGPIAFDRAGDLQTDKQIIRGRELVRRVSGYLLLISAAAVGVFIVLDEFIVRLFTSDQFIRFAPFLPWLAIGALATKMGDFLSLEGHTVQRSALYIIPNVVRAVVIVGGGYILGLHYGIAGVVGALVAGGVTYCSAIFFVNSRLGVNGQPHSREK